ncbi:DUF3693 domain-containing protein [Pseudoxanthomonas indica]|nr:DUF3693 domain-containing protein [Pseudoxanthomonas indica]
MVVKDFPNMSIVATLLDKARARRGIPTDMALAERLGRSRAVVSEWRAGKSYPDEDLIVALAELAGDDPGEWLLAIKAIRTEGKAGKVWASLAKRLATASAVLLCAIGLAVGTPAQAAPVRSTSATDAQGMQIMSLGNAAYVPKEAQGPKPRIALEPCWSLLYRRPTV